MIFCGDEAVASMLGIAKDRRTALGLADAITSGLSVSALDRLSNRVAPGDVGFSSRIVPRATLARRKKAPGARLSVEEGDRVARLARVWAFAKDVWGEEESARAFLFRPHALLDGRRPVDVTVGTEVGARLVEDILGGLKYGTAV